MQPPLLIGALADNAGTQRQLINYAMICSGLFTLIHVRLISSTAKCLAPALSQTSIGLSEKYGSKFPAQDYLFISGNCLY